MKNMTQFCICGPPLAYACVFLLLAQFLLRLRLSNRASAHVIQIESNDTDVNAIGTGSEDFAKSISNAEDRNLLSDCQHLYLDVGSNKGIQVRKLFQPSLYPKALIKPYFEEYFGIDR